MKRLTITVAVVALTLVTTSLPFLPGRYDALAVPLSWIARAVGMTSLLFVRVGLVWLSCELWSTRDGKGCGRVRFLIASLAAGSIATLGVTVVALTQSGAPLAVGVLTAWGFVLWQG